MSLAVPATELAAIATLWKSTRRELVTSFLGTSMLPTIAPGQEVTIHCGRPFERGDVVVLILGAAIVVHRVELLSSDRHRLLTRGDHHILPDFPATADEVLGIVIDVPPPPRGLMRALVLQACRPVFHRDQEICRDLVRTLRLFSIPGLIARVTRRFRELRQPAA